MNFASGKIPLGARAAENVYIVHQPKRRPNMVQGLVDLMVNFSPHSSYRATQLCYRGLRSRNSVRLSVCLPHACFVANPENLPAIFFIPHESAILLSFAKDLGEIPTGSPPTRAPPPNRDGVG